ncbi:hypothetical protein K7X08_012374 [Anisodus acutangulus]|uniref:Uncharacterized protein n=1 Tax=Anisodus acutangulus TaxID=402998 RepID=A0A9Q1LD14_9SOLA|nr:hypothetical protein K7X08_012374 [Anisodus acutangulus]
MASACVNKEKFLDCSPTAKYKSYGWLSPRMSFSAVDTSNKPPEDFEFPLEDPVINMFPADELFSNGKLIPLHLSSMTRPVITTPQQVVRMRNNEISDPYLFSPKVPRCTTRWRELLGLKKQQHQKVEIQRTSSLPSTNTTHKSLKHFLHHRSSKSLSSSIDSNNSSLNLPLLTKDSDIESVSISSRLSLSSSYSDLPRLSLDSDKPNSSPRIANIPRRVRLLKHRVSSSSEAITRTSRSCVTESNVTTVRGVSVDSPRMNSSGKIVFHSLERSSSSPSTSNGGPRYKHRGMERSYLANVRVTPVLNVPLCKSGVGFLLFSSSSSSSNATGNKGQYHSNNSRPRTDRIKK